LGPDARIAAGGGEEIVVFRANVSAALADPKPKAAMAELIITFEVPPYGFGPAPPAGVQRESPRG
jgi:hypothetical protein